MHINYGTIPQNWVAVHCHFILDTQISSGANPCQSLLWTKYEWNRFSTNISISLFSIIPPMHHIHSFIHQGHQMSKCEICIILNNMKFPLPVIWISDVLILCFHGNPYTYYLRMKAVHSHAEWCKVPPVCCCHSTRPYSVTTYTTTISGHIQFWSLMCWIWTTSVFRKKTVRTSNLQEEERLFHQNISTLIEFVPLCSWNNPNITSSSNVYWTMHHCNGWRMKDQLDVTCYLISLLMCSACFGH